VLYGVIVSTLLDAGWGKGAYQTGIFSFLILMLIGVALLRGVPDRRTEEDGTAPPPMPPASDLADSGLL
jgi:hypothetical protein